MYGTIVLCVRIIPFRRRRLRRSRRQCRALTFCGRIRRRTKPYYIRTRRSKYKYYNNVHAAWFTPRPLHPRETTIRSKTIRAGTYIILSESFTRPAGSECDIACRCRCCCCTYIGVPSVPDFVRNTHTHTQILCTILFAIGSVTFIILHTRVIATYTYI